MQSPTLMDDSSQHSATRPGAAHGAGRTPRDVGSEATAAGGTAPEEQFEHTVERFRMLAGAAFDGIGISQDGKVVEVNDQLATLLGWERAELIGRDVLSFVAPEARERVAIAMRAGLDDAYEHPAVRKDGSLLTVEVRGKVIRLGGRDARVTVVRDVTRRRRVEDAVRAIVEGTSVVGVEFFGALTRAVANALGVRWAFIAALVPSRGRAAAEPFSHIRTLAFGADGRLVEGGQFPLAGTPCERVVARGMCHFPEGLREQFPNDQRLAALNVSAYLGVPLLATSGEPLGVLVAMHDRRIERCEIVQAVFSMFAGRAAAEMDRLRSDEALRRSEACLRATIEAAPHVAIQWYDTDGRVLLWNGASENIFGFSARDALGKTLDQLMLSGEGSRGFVDRIAAILHSSQPSSPSEYRYRRPDGSEGTCLSTTFRISDGDDGPRVACMDVDITERRRAEQRKAELEEQLRHAHQLESLGTFAGGIAHDFNNILTAIFAYGDLAASSLDEPERAREHLAELHEAAVRARELVRQILIFSRRQTQARTAVKLQQTVQEALKFLRSILPSTIQIDSAIDWKAPMVLASPIQMYQVIVNLCMNAAQAMQGGPGRLELRLSSVAFASASDCPVPELAPGRYVHLSVRDSGQGMDAATLSRIFEPFFTTKASDEGTGLGLSVVRSIVHEHQGAVWASSELGKGSTFEVLIPALDQEEQRRPEGTVARQPGKGERVLLVDDESSLCEASRAVLDGSGYRVTAYTDPARAYEAFSRAPHDVDIAITDLTMPNMTGTELARRLHAIRPDLPVVLISGFASRPELAELRSVGVRAFVPKPFKPSELAATVRRMLDDPISATG
jgi:PAS domain S-box-containing protein